MDTMPIRGNAEILPTEGAAQMLLMMDRIEQAARFTPPANYPAKHRK